MKGVATAIKCVTLRSRIHPTVKQRICCRHFTFASWRSAIARFFYPKQTKRPKPLCIIINNEFLVGQKYFVDHKNYTILLIHIADRDVGRTTLGVGDSQFIALASNGKRTALHGLQ